MIKYTTKDIIKRAEQLTDFTSSDFISIREKTNLLNDSYTIVYQTLIANGDKTFLKKTTISKSEQLPADLYQIRTVYAQNNILVKKTTPSQSEGYDIVNGCIEGSFDFYTIEYYPNPKTLFLKDDSLEDLGINKSCLTYNDIFYAVKEENTLTMYGTGDNSILKTQSDSLDAVCHLANGLVNLTEKKFYPYGSNSPYSFDVLMVRGNTATLDKVISNNINENVVLYVTDSSEERHYFIDSELNIYNDSECTELITTLPASELFYCRQDGLYVAEQNAQYMRRIGEEFAEWLPLPIWSFICFVDDTHIVVSDGENLKKTGFGFDSFLEYPNNVFYTYLAYDLAISMCSVVQRDSTALEAKTDEIRAQLFNSIQQDANEVYTIKDVHNIRSSIYGN